MPKVTRKEYAPQVNSVKDQDVYDLDSECEKANERKRLAEILSPIENSSSSSFSLSTSGYASLNSSSRTSALPLRASNSLTSCEAAVTSRKHRRDDLQVSDENDPSTSDQNACNRYKRLSNDTPGALSVNMLGRSTLGGSVEANAEDSEHNVRLRQLKTSSWFGKPPMSSQEEAEKGTEVALRKMLTSFSSRLDGDISTHVLAETDVKTVMSRFPPLQDRDLEMTKDALYFNSFFYSSKSQNKEIKEIAGALQAVLVGQDIQRVSFFLIFIKEHLLS